MHALKGKLCLAMMTNGILSCTSKFYYLYASSVYCVGVYEDGSMRFVILCYAVFGFALLLGPMFCFTFIRFFRYIFLISMRLC